MVFRTCSMQRRRREGLKVSLCRLREDQLVKGQVGHRPTQPLVLLLQLLQQLQLIGLHPAVLTLPAVVRHLRHADLTNRIRHRRSLRLQNLDLPQLRDNLLRPVCFLAMVQSPPPTGQDPYLRVDHFSGAGSDRQNALRLGVDQRPVGCIISA